MDMTYDEAVMRYDLISGLKYVDGENKLSRDLKIKLIRMKIELSKVYNEFNSYRDACIDELKNDELNTLVAKEERTEEENNRINELAEYLNDELGIMLNKKAREIVSVSLDNLNEEEFNEILLVNVENDINMNGQSVDAANYLDLFHQLFVKE